jgi:hypothetical protein
MDWFLFAVAGIGGIVIGLVLSALVGMLRSDEQPAATDQPEATSQPAAIEPLTAQEQPVVIEQPAVGDEPADPLAELLAETAEQAASDQPVAQEQPAAQPEAEPNWNECLCLGHDAHSQGLLVQVDGRVYRDEDELDVEQRRRVAVAAYELNQWIEEPRPVSQLGALQISQPPAAPPPTLTSAPAPAQPANPKPEAAPAKPKQKWGLSQVLEAYMKPPEPKPLSMTQQVDEILQKRLAGTDLAEREISLIEAADHSMRVIVGSEQYEAVDAVPDEAVRAAIQAAVAEWLQRSQQEK